LRGDYFVIFNCGVEAGASVGHKHMQILPHSTPDKFKFFPDADTPDRSPLTVGTSDLGFTDTDGNICATPDVPFQHAFLAIPRGADASLLLQIYYCIASSLRLDLQTPHNMIMTDRWMMVIPRRQARVGIMAANASAMVGMVWVTSEQQYEAWTARDPMAWLSTFGKPANTS